jgi:hypothetical protein
LKKVNFFAEKFAEKSFSFCYLCPGLRPLKKGRGVEPCANASSKERNPLKTNDLYELDKIRHGYFFIDTGVGD